MSGVVRFEQLMHTYKDDLYCVFLRMTQQEGTAKLFLKGAFVTAYKQFSSYDEAVSLKIWLYRTVIQQWQQRKQVEVPPLRLKAGREQQLERLIARLPETERLIFLLRYGGVCSYEEMAAILSMPVVHVQQAFDEAKQKMRDEVREARG